LSGLFLVSRQLSGPATIDYRGSCLRHLLCSRQAASSRPRKKHEVVVGGRLSLLVTFDVPPVERLSALWDWSVVLCFATYVLDYGREFWRHFLAEHDKGDISPAWIELLEVLIRAHTYHARFSFNVLIFFHVIIIFITVFCSFYSALVPCLLGELMFLS
jgi:hypothetical protein